MRTNLATRLTGTFLTLALVSFASDLKLKEGDHKTLGKLVGAYFDALGEEKGIQEAMAKVLSQIESKEKSMKGQKLLASPADWEEVFRLVTEQGLSETLKKKGEPTAAKLKTDPEINVAYCVPKKAAKGPLPLIIIACDSGEVPLEHLNTFWNDPTVREGAILVAIELGKDAQSWGIFGSPSAPGGPYQIMIALGQIQREFPVDYNRRYLVASGKAFAAVEATATAYPFLFAGVIGIGDVSMVDPSSLENFRTLPTLFLKGSEGAKAIETKIGELGFANCRLEPEGTAAQAWEWMDKNPRNSYPAQISYSPKFDNATAVHWISLQGFQVAEKPHIEAKADKATNTVTIEADKVGKLIIWLNDELVDLEKPVKFIVNGTQHEATVPRNAPQMINNQYSFGDWGRVFAAAVTQDVPPK